MLRPSYLLAGGLALGALIVPSDALACTPAPPTLNQAVGPGGVVGQDGAIFVTIYGGSAPDLILTSTSSEQTHQLSPQPLADNGDIYIPSFATVVARYDMPEGIALGDYDVAWGDSGYWGSFEPLTVQGDVSPALFGNVHAGDVKVSQDGHFRDLCIEFSAGYSGDDGTPYVMADLSWNLPEVEGGGAFALVTERQSGALAGSIPLREGGPSRLESGYRWPVDSAPEAACFTLEIYGTNGALLLTEEHPCVSLGDLPTPTPTGQPTPTLIPGTTPTPTPPITPTPSPTIYPTPTPTLGSTPTPSATPVPSPTPTQSVTPTPTDIPGDGDDGGCTSQKNEMLLPGLLLIPLVGLVRRRRV